MTHAAAPMAYSFAAVSNGMMLHIDLIYYALIFPYYPYLSILLNHYFKNLLIASGQPFSKTQVFKIRQ